MKTARVILILACATLPPGSGILAQAYSPRSRDYLFAATAGDTRALWVNPAGLAVVPEASLLAEFVLNRPTGGDLRLSQVSVGFNSQGLSFGYNRERLVSDSSNHTYSLAFARALPRWSIGFAVSHFRSGVNDVGFDLGIRYRILPSLHLGAVLRNIGEPQLRTDTLPLTGVAGLGWALLPRFLILTGETIARSRLAESGYDVSYRAGALLSLGGAIPITGLTAVSLNSDFGVAMWSFGVALGGTRRAVIVAGAVPHDPALHLESVSLTAIAVNPLATRPRFP